MGSELEPAYSSAYLDGSYRTVRGLPILFEIEGLL